jgi:hypothetical protein
MKGSRHMTPEERELPSRSGSMPSVYAVESIGYTRSDLTSQTGPAHLDALGRRPFGEAELQMPGSDAMAGAGHLLDEDITKCKLQVALRT